jgi:hypothetical protein
LNYKHKTLIMKKIRSNFLAASAGMAACLLIGAGDVFADSTGDSTIPNYGTSAKICFTAPSPDASSAGPSSFSGQAIFVPEPTSAACLLLGLGALACLKRFKTGRRIN